MSNAVINITKSKSTTSRPLRTSRQQISAQLVGTMQSVTVGAGPTVGFDGTTFAKGGNSSSRLEHSQRQMIKSLTSNQTPNFSNFHPPAIQKYDGSSPLQG